MVSCPKYYDHTIENCALKPASLDECEHCSRRTRYFNLSYYVRSEDGADRFLADYLKRGKLVEGWVFNDGTESHPWVIRGVKP